MDLFSKIKDGDHAALSKGITLLESSLESEKKLSEKLISDCMPYSGNSIRIGITGVPGVGKSTFIETFGKLLTSQGNKVAVLAIDPSSGKTQGSILGDKSRMTKLAVDKNAFIRPSPSKGTLGGISNNTRESIILCEAAGFNIILIETVGVGQSETTVSNIVDFFLLLIIAGAGDELQGIKRGIMELADMIAITKADGENIQNTKNAQQEYLRSIHLFPAMENGWTPTVKTCSATENIGINEIWEKINSHNEQMIINGWKTRNRDRQDIYWLHYIIKDELGKKEYHRLLSNGRLKKLEQRIKNNSISGLLDSL